MSRFCFCNCPAGFSADPERHAPDCPGRSGAGKARTPGPDTTPALKVSASEELDAVLHWRGKHAQAIKERNALQQSLTAAEEELDQCHSMALMIEEKEWAEHVGKGSISSRVESAFTQLHNELSEARKGLTAADERADVLEGLLRLARGAIGENQWTLLTKDIDAMLSQDAQRTNNSGNAHCPHDGICHTSEERCAEAQARIESLTTPAGAGQ